MRNSELFPALKRPLPLECTRRGLSFEWSHLWGSSDRSVFGSLPVLAEVRFIPVHKLSFIMFSGISVNG